jgi:hypothetical protein
MVYQKSPVPPGCDSNSAGCNGPEKAMIADTASDCRIKLGFVDANKT